MGRILSESGATTGKDASALMTPHSRRLGTWAVAALAILLVVDFPLFEREDDGSLILIQPDAATHCPFYSARRISDVQVGPSPDWLRDKLGSSVVVIGAVVDGRPQLVAAVTKDVAARGVNAGSMVKTIAKTIGGGGGGSPQMAQAGGKDGEMLPDALGQVPAWVAEHLS